MNLSNKAQEILEKYWIENNEKKDTWYMKIASDKLLAEELINGNYAICTGDNLELSEKGWIEARSCVRRHRLAERLLADVLAVRKEMIHEMGCEFEHVLQKNVEENICILLGHPQTCPHGRPIPEGECCRDNKLRPRKLVHPLSECKKNEKGEIAYIRVSNENDMNKLTAMGLLPGMNIRLLRKTPSYLFQMGESQFAVDKKLERDIEGIPPSITIKRKGEKERSVN